MEKMTTKLVRSQASIGRWMSTAVAGKSGEGSPKLYPRLAALGSKTGLVESTINAYLREGKRALKDDLTRCARELRRFRRYPQALEIYEWMDTRNMAMSFTDLAIRLDLTGKVHGIDAAEKYFNDLIPQQKNKFTYGALLNCYCVEKLKDKALALFQKMNETNIKPTSLAFNNIMSLYMRLGEFQKVAPLVEEMKKMNVGLSTFTYNIWMNSLSSLGNIEAVERVFEEIKQEGGKLCDWTTYSNLAVAYVKNGHKEKAELALKMVEQVMETHNREAFHYLLSLYASISNLDEVHRIWKSLKSNLTPVTNVSYLTMLQALSKLKDIEGLKNLFEEWESVCSSYDIRLANCAIGAYLRNDMVDEAEAVLHHALERSNVPFDTACELLMLFYVEKRNIQLALRCLDGTASRLVESGLRPSPESRSRFLGLIEEEKDVDSAEKLFKLLKKVKCLNKNVYKSLLRTYIAAGRTGPTMRERIKGDGVDIDTELENLLQSVCSD